MSVIFTRMPSSARIRHAARPASQMGSLMTIFGASAASRRPSATMPSTVVAVVSADTGRPLQSSAIFCMWGSKSARAPPVLAYRLGLVVTPARHPQLFASAISSRFVVSMKNFKADPFSRCATGPVYARSHKGPHRTGKGFELKRVSRHPTVATRAQAVWTSPRDGQRSRIPA